MNTDFLDAHERHHDDADETWPRFGAYQSGHASGARYALPHANPFSDWHIDQRHAHRSMFTAAVIQPHADAARLVKGLIHQAGRDGLL